MSEQSSPKSRTALAATSFFISPLVAEFLLGNLPIKLLPALIVLAPMYGGGALLIRETVRRAGRGWPSIVVLGVGYGVFEEAFTTQSLFNPNYLHLNLHLLDPAYVAFLGIGARWTIFVITLHAAWSISTSIALVEALAPKTATRPWLGGVGFTVTAVLLCSGSDGEHSDWISTRSLLSFNRAIGVRSRVLPGACFACVRNSSGDDGGRDVGAESLDGGCAYLDCGFGVSAYSARLGLVGGDDPAYS